MARDYEVFLIARIREFWLASDRTRAGMPTLWHSGSASTGRVVTAAALVMAITFAGLIASQVSFLRFFGVGLTVAMLVDATVIRSVLLPALMVLLGRWNWWAPPPLARLHDRLTGCGQTITSTPTAPAFRLQQTATPYRSVSDGEPPNARRSGFTDAPPRPPSTLNATRAAA